MTQLRSRLLMQTLDELRRLKAAGPRSSYRSALQVAAPGLLEGLLEHYEELESTSSEQICHLIADWLWLRMLGWCQTHRVPDSQREDLFTLVESVRVGLPLPMTAVPSPSPPAPVSPPTTEISITILRHDVSPDGNLPSQFFPGAGSDGALFQVTPKIFPFPDYESICSALTRWDRDTVLMDYDQTTGKGYFRLVDSSAPQSGQVINLSDLVEDF